MTDPVIVKDTISVSPAWEGIFFVSALLTTGTREEGQYVSVSWNPTSGNVMLVEQMVAAYNEIFTCQAAVLQASIREAIGTEMAVVVPEPAETTMTITATTVYVNEAP